MPTVHSHKTLVVRRLATTAAACLTLLLASCGTVPTHDEGAFPPQSDGREPDSAHGTRTSTAVPSVPPAPNTCATDANAPAAGPDGAECSLVRPCPPAELGPRNKTGLAMAYGNVRLDDTFDRRSEWFYGQGVEDRFSSIFMTYTIEF